MRGLELLHLGKANLWRHDRRVPGDPQPLQPEGQSQAPTLLGPGLPHGPGWGRVRGGGAVLGQGSLGCGPAQPLVPFPSVKESAEPGIPAGHGDGIGI